MVGVETMGIAIVSLHHGYARQLCIRLPRFSGYQAQSGVQTRDVRGMSDQEKLKVIQGSGQNAVVLLYMQGHIALPRFR